MEQTAVGLVAAKDGWFTVSVRDAAWMTGDAFGDACVFAGDAAPFRQIGYTRAMLRP